MRVGGSLTALALGSFLGAFWLRQARARRVPKALVAAAPAPHPSTVVRPGDIRS
jgi:hypothetical protein